MKKIQKTYKDNLYLDNLMVEYHQSVDEGIDIEKYESLFKSVAEMPNGEVKEKIADALNELVLSLPQKSDYKYNEPSELDEIKKLRKPYPFQEQKPDYETLTDKIHGAWLGRVIGCLLGKPVEGIRSDEFIPLLKNSGNYPMHRYILSSDITQEMLDTYKFGLRDKCYADTVDGMPVDDDTNYVTLAQLIIEKYGRDFTAQNVADAWVRYQPKTAYFTAEYVAYCNFLEGYEPPYSAVYKNPFREWIGAQIRGDYFGYINPGNPELAAEMAFRDASISHIKNGIYGEMFASAMIACAAVTDNIKDIILGGLAQIPSTSRLYEEIINVIKDYENGVTYDEFFKKLHSSYDEYDGHGWCHTLSNAIIVAGALLYGNGDFGKSLCLAVQSAFDTDCNGATVGSILGMRGGAKAIPEEWSKPVNDTLHTSILGVGTVSVSECAKATMKHVLFE